MSTTKAAHNLHTTSTASPDLHTACAQHFPHLCAARKIPQTWPSCPRSRGRPRHRCPHPPDRRPRLWEQLAWGAVMGEQHAGVLGQMRLARSCHARFRVQDEICSGASRAFKRTGQQQPRQPVNLPGAASTNHPLPSLTCGGLLAPRLLGLLLVAPGEGGGLLKQRLQRRLCADGECRGGGWAPSADKRMQPTSFCK